MQKALFNGRDVYNPVKGSFQRDLNNTGDVNSEGLYQKCTSKSTNFGSLTKGVPEILWMNGHIVRKIFFNFRVLILEKKSPDQKEFVM
ncbi:MAG: hypothetical protein MJ252_21245 [archaeon]|nr:hypothetical protein [archaeon]